MKNVITQGIVLARTNFREADRIVTIITPDHGKVRLIAKGVRRPASKLAGGIELFSLSHITYLVGRGELQTLVSSRLITHFANIVRDIDRTMLGYDLLKRLNRVTEDAAGEEYFIILKAALGGLNDLELTTDLTELWLTMQLLKVTGHTPNLKFDVTGEQLQADQTYLFDFENMAFRAQLKGLFNANHIKLLRLGYALEEPGALRQVKDAEKQSKEALKLVKTMLSRSVRI